MLLLTREECIAIAAGMTRAWRQGYEAGARGWTTISDLMLSQSTMPGWADAYRMGLAAGQRDRACITAAGIPQIPDWAAAIPSHAGA